MGPQKGKGFSFGRGAGRREKRIGRRRGEKGMEWVRDGKMGEGGYWGMNRGDYGYL